MSISTASTEQASTEPTATQPAAPEDPATDVRWLSDAEQHHWRMFRDGTARLTNVLAHDLEASSGLSTHEYEVLVRLSEQPGRTQRMSALADDLAHSRSRLTHTVRRMEERGLVTRSSCSADARGVNCTMTELGWTTLVAAAPLHVQQVRDHLVDLLTPEQFAALGEAMEIVRTHLVSGPCHAVSVD
ncbi:winged helix-turn-helix transcriptional regulator [Cellulomonas sp. JH27-2]|uniref:MarR family winged helix-turn-helix transcriptional regulator n=1 Tax=Cellulomonas sp. JH27-2 TaxID=2774139 RepID=UPI00177E6B2E|nr:MarR family winged helix-turn-helix transcriptional regulator [Cellulomonas sp. JH27-2]MBD8057470.1 winged helix-turn-helix transcriptional regulator [Cellulomonas sp. JH27-2]